MCGSLVKANIYDRNKIIWIQLNLILRILFYNQILEDLLIGIWIKDIIIFPVSKKFLEFYVNIVFLIFW